MKYAEVIPGILILALRLPCVARANWVLDWISVLSLLWVLVAMTPEDSRARKWAVGVGCSWLVAIYAINQAGWTFAGWN
jgi:hypothetical protein